MPKDSGRFRYFVVSNDPVGELHEDGEYPTRKAARAAVVGLTHRYGTGWHFRIRAVLREQADSFDRYVSPLKE